MKYVIVSKSYSEEEYLAHHGIKGQKWGERHGPPYPLEYDSHTGLEKRLNPTAELSKYDNVIDQNGRQTNKNLLKDHERIYDAYRKSINAKYADAKASESAERTALAKKRASGQISEEEYTKESDRLAKKYSKVNAALQKQSDAEATKAADVLRAKYGEYTEEKLAKAEKQRARGRAVAWTLGAIGVVSALATLNAYANGAFDKPSYGSTLSGAAARDRRSYGDAIPVDFTVIR